MKQLILSLLLSCLILFGAGYATSITFRDINDSQYKDSILFLAERSIVTGYPDGTYGPERDISRAELLKIILEGAQTNIGSGTNCFPDVKKERFAPYVCYAKNNGLIRGYPDGTFKPNQKVTIAEGLKITLAGFDAGIIEGSGMHWYQPYVTFVHNNNIFSQYSIIPYNNMNRGKMAYLVHQLLIRNHMSQGAVSRRVYSSLGCGKTAPLVPPTSSIVNGVQRNYITVVGQGYNPQLPTKLIIAFHGRTNPNTLVRTYYNIEQASQGQAIIVYPSGLPEEGPVRSRQNPGDKPNNLRDYALFDTIVQDISSSYCIDKDHIYVVGHSLGAWFANSLACHVEMGFVQLEVYDEV